MAQQRTTLSRPTSASAGPPGARSAHSARTAGMRPLPAVAGLLSTLLVGGSGLCSLAAAAVSESSPLGRFGMNLTFTDDPEARCLDGSPYGYQLQLHATSRANWTISIQGGGWCYDEMVRPRGRCATAASAAAPSDWELIVMTAATCLSWTLAAGLLRAIEDRPRL